MSIQDSNETYPHFSKSWARFLIAPSLDELKTMQFHFLRMEQHMRYSLDDLLAQALTDVRPVQLCLFEAAALNPRYVTEGGFHRTIWLYNYGNDSSYKCKSGHLRCEVRLWKEQISKPSIVKRVFNYFTQKTTSSSSSSSNIEEMWHLQYEESLYCHSKLSHVDALQMRNIAIQSL